MSHCGTRCAQYLESRGALPHRRVRHRGGDRAATSRAHCDSGADFDCDGVVLATDVAGLQRIVDGSPGLGDDDWRARVATMGTAPPFVVQRLWLDRPVIPDRAPFLGTGGRPPLDNVSVLERYEREAAEWCDRTGGSVVELHSYSVTDPTTTSATGMLARLHELYPETCRTRRSSTNACCAATTAPASRPATSPHGRRSPPRIRAVMLAGDGIRIDLPVALMERAATTGWSAANRLLAHFGLAGHDLHTVPVTGPVGRAAAARAAGKAAGAMSMLDGLNGEWAKSSPFKVLPRAAVGEPAAHLQGRRARDHRRRAGAVAAHGRAATGMRSPPATTIRKSPFGTSVGGVEIVAWRDADGTLHVGPGDLPAPRAPTCRRARWTAAH